eukprot:TRINITY_DN17183_c0_g1_i1.p1 TRINITY_DN17183_c0_g1~~TRINITY_DN17183_c0_g1_i1.p1  ORF type:complete len:660 (-),score=125.88 TRINITY_DN17183_c0_g1_i1:22-1941(-)
MEAAEMTVEVQELLSALVGQLPAEARSDLQCPQCGCTLHDPWTLGSGRTVCASCVTRVKGEHVQPVANRLLASIVSHCLPHAAEAASKRLEGNELFKKGSWQEAVESYSAALHLDKLSPASFANRSLANLKMQRHSEAIEDARHAVEMRPLWAKWQLRLALALRAEGRSSEALVPLLRAVALDQAETKLATGSCVEIRGLKNAAKFNGSKGTCVRFDDGSARWEVRLQGGRELKVKKENLVLMSTSVDCGARKELADLLQTHSTLPSLESLLFQRCPEPRRVSLDQVEGLRDDLDCCLCSNLLCEPTVLPCGHCMCRDCVARLLDHALQKEPVCPLCRHGLRGLLKQINLRAREQQRSGLRFAHGSSQLTVCSELSQLFASWFPKEYEERLAEVRAPQNEWVPIFVCSLSAPFIPTPLHVFEPRYRLMMRRAIESNQRFGMCLPAEDGEGFADTGTMLFIDRFEQLPDGRSMVGTKGVSRFSVLQRGELDGYATALIRPFEEDAQGFPSSAAFHTEALALHSAARDMLGSLGTEMTERLEHQLGPLPAIDSLHFDAHMSFYSGQMLQVFGGGNESGDIVFLQPESERWKLLLRHCRQFRPFKEKLDALGAEEDADQEAWSKRLKTEQAKAAVEEAASGE